MPLPRHWRTPPPRPAPPRRRVPPRHRQAGAAGGHDRGRHRLQQRRGGGGRLRQVGNRAGAQHLRFHRIDHQHVDQPGQCRRQRPRRRGVQNHLASGAVGNACCRHVRRVRHLLLQHEPSGALDHRARRRDTCRVQGQVDAGDDDRAVVAARIDDRDTYPGTHPGSHCDLRRIDTRRAQVRQQPDTERIVTDRADHRRAGAVPCRLDRL
ncbi:MAG TPA: hypothetical protein VME92_07720, partial [Acetobacteraceae bacterium]|nr:hypothetical protein [Acetobacteraceae bacterium]